MRTILDLFIKHIDIISVFVIGVFTISNLFHSGFFPTHDGENHIVRFYEFDKTLREGNWYPLWATDLNYTYGLPLFNYVYPLPNYVASFFHLFDISLVDSFKLNLIVASIIGSFTSYIYGKSKFGKWGGVIMSTFYTLAPYHLLDIYIRGSVGEVWALALFPLCIYSFDRTTEHLSPSKIATAAVIYALVIFSHNILALMFTLFLLFYCMFLVFQQKKKLIVIVSFALCFIGGLGLSSVFILPAILEQTYVVGLKIYDVLENFSEIYQLLIPSWGSGYSGQSSLSQMSFQIGLGNLVVVFLVIFKIFQKRFRNNLIIFYLISFFFLTFMTTTYSSYIWQKIEFIQFFQFPWRILSLIIFCCAFIAGSITRLYRSKVVYVALMIFVFLTTFSYARAPYFWNRDEYHYISRENFIHGSNSIGNAFQTKWLSQQKKLPVKNENIMITENKSHFKNFQVNSSNNQIITFPTAYFPGWKAEVNGKEAKLLNIEGKIGAKVPKGKSTVKLRLEDTTVRLISKYITVITLIALILALFKTPVVQYFYARSHR